jgi:hypothetical protein
LDESTALGGVVPKVLQSNADEIQDIIQVLSARLGPASSLSVPAQRIAIPKSTAGVLDKVRKATVSGKNTNPLMSKVLSDVNSPKNIATIKGNVDRYANNLVSKWEAKQIIWPSVSKRINRVSSILNQYPDTGDISLALDQMPPFFSQHVFDADDAELIRLLFNLKYKANMGRLQRHMLKQDINNWKRARLKK